MFIMDIELQRVLEFHDLYPNEADLDIEGVLKKYSKIQIVKVVVLLGQVYGNAYIPDSERTFFSKESEGYKQELNTRIGSVLKKYNINRICYATIRTSLELMRYAFAIPYESYLNIGNSKDFEYDLFRVILMINEKLMSFKNDPKLSLDELLYFNYFATNDLNYVNVRYVFITQSFYALSLFDFLDRYRPDLLHRLVAEKWKLTSHNEYTNTIAALFIMWQKSIESQRLGYYYIDIDNVNYEQSGISIKVLDLLSVGIEELIPYSDADRSKRDNNVDYRTFRSKPLVKIDDKKYCIYNCQILIERLYNSLYFDIKDIWSEQGDYNSFYNAHFVEGYLFRHVMKNCVRPRSFFFPTIDMIDSHDMHEKDKQPDFYIRERETLLIFECKGFKLHGALKDKADIADFLFNLKQKIYESTENLDCKRKKKKKPEPVGVTQLINHIEKIDADEFCWDTGIPDEVVYLPIIVLEDTRCVQPGLMSIVNKWADELIKDRKLTDVVRYPFIIMSIDTLFLYDELFRQRGFYRILSEFLEEAQKVNEQGKESIISYADFNVYMHEKYRLSNHKKKDINYVFRKMVDRTKW